MTNTNPRDLITLRDVKLIFRNFSGEARRFNNEGDRNFVVVLNDDQAAELESRGYKVKTLPPYHDGDDPQNILKVKVSYKYQKPVVVVMTSGTRNELDADTIGFLDNAYIQRADLSFRGSAWTTVDGSSGVTAYLNSLYVTLEEDDLAKEYAESTMAPSLEEEVPF